MLKQSTYRHERQDWLNRVAETIWESATLRHGDLLLPGEPEIPTLIETPYLINGYNRNPAHYDPERNLVIAHMAYSQEMNTETAWRGMIVHEMSHWLQHRLLCYRPTRDTHTHTSWATACWIVAETLGVDKPLDFFKPLTSKRVNGQVRRVQREGSLIVTELHGFPGSMPDVVKAIGLL